MLSKDKIIREIWQIIIWFALAVLFVYIRPFSIFKHVFFLVPLYLFYKSKKDYFWIAFFFVLINAPAYFFTSQTQAAQFVLPYYGLNKGFSLTIFDLFLFIGIFKVFKRVKRKRLILNKPLVIFGLYFIIITIPISIVLGTSLDVFANMLRPIIYYFLVVVLLNLFTVKEDYIKFAYLIIPFTILILMDQLIYLSFGERIIYLFDQSKEWVVINSVTGTSRGISSGVLLVFFSLIFGLQIQSKPKLEIFNNIGIILIIISFGSFFLSATRAWIAIGLIQILIVTLLSKRSVRLILRIGFISVIGLVILLSTNIVKSSMIDDVFARMDIASAFITGQTDKVDTYQDRIENDIPKVMKGINKSPIFGVGLSKIYKDSYSNDVGYINTILLWGYLGFSFFLYYLSRIIYRTYSALKNKDNCNSTLSIPLLGALMAMLFGYLFTWDFFSFYPHKIFFVSLIFAYLEFLYQDEIKTRLKVSYGN